MITRPPLRYAIGLAAAVGLAGQLPAVPAAATADSTTAAWTNVRLTCKKFTAGEVCVALQKNGTTHRGMFYVIPAAGQWIRPAARAAWAAVDSDWQWWQSNLEAVGGGYQPVCAGGCPALTSPRVYYVTSYSAEAVHTLLFDTPQGRFDVHAGLTRQAHRFTRTCPGPAVAKAWGLLTSTNDGNVWYQRSVGADATNRPRVLQATDTGGYTFYTKTWSGTVADDYEFRSPTYTKLWQRFRSDHGLWTTASTRAVLKYITTSGNVAYSASDFYDEQPC